MIQRQRRPEWTNNSSKVGYAKGQISDEQYHLSLAITDPLWRYIILHYPKEAYGQCLSLVNIIGYETLPVGIELSQWGYKVTFIADKPEDVKKAKKDCEIHAGNLKDSFFFNFLKNVPNTTVTCFIGVLDWFKKDKDIHDYLDLLLRRSEEIVCCVKDDRWWGDILRDKYEYKLMKHPTKNLVFLMIKQLER